MRTRETTLATPRRDILDIMPPTRIDAPLASSATSRQPRVEAREASAQDAGRLIIVSNRLPYRFEDDGEGGFAFARSVGGLATGLGPLHEQDGNLWIGWADADACMDEEERAHLSAALGERACRPVFLDGTTPKRTTRGSRTPPSGRCSTDFPSSPASTKRNGRPIAA